MKLSLINQFTQFAITPGLKILELGTRRWDIARPTHHESRIGMNAKSYVKCDFMDGLDVDVVADAHELSKHFEEQSFDAVIAVSVFEHLRKPWLVSEEIFKIVKPGGQVYIHTHQTFPVHGYPDDYFRFTDKALEACFDQPWSKKISIQNVPCKIIPLENINGPWNFEANGFIGAEFLGVK